MTEVFYDHLAKTRHQIHQHPEVSGEEHETTVFLKAYLKNLGVEPLNYPLKTDSSLRLGQVILLLPCVLILMPYRLRKRQVFLMLATMVPCMLVVMIFTRPLCLVLLSF